MKYEKIAISLPLRAAEHVRRAVKRGEAPSVSAYITAAIEERAKQVSLRDLLDQDLEATGGPITPDERAWIDYVVGPRPWRGPIPPQPASITAYRYEHPKKRRTVPKKRRSR